MTSTRPSLSRSLSRQVVKHPPPSFPRTAQVAEPAVEGAWSEGADGAWPWAHERDAASPHETARETHEKRQEKARAPGADAGDPASAHHERGPASPHAGSSSFNMQRKMERVAATPSSKAFGPSSKAFGPSSEAFGPPIRDIAPKRPLDGSLAIGEQESLGEQEWLGSERPGSLAPRQQHSLSSAPRQQQSLWSGEDHNKAHQLPQERLWCMEVASASFLLGGRRAQDLRPASSIGGGGGAGGIHAPSLHSGIHPYTNTQSRWSDMSIDAMSIDAMSIDAQLLSAEETLESSSVSFLSRPIPPYNTLMKLKREAVAPSKAVSKREERPERADEADAPMTRMLPLSHAHTSSHSLALSPSLAPSPSNTARHGGGIHLTAPESQERQQERVRRPSPALISGSNASNLRMRAAPSKSLDKEIVWHQHYNLEGDITGTARQESLMEREYQRVLSEVLQASDES